MFDRVDLLLIFNAIALFCLASCGNIKVIHESGSKSKYFMDSLYSKSLGEYRKHNIYLPPKFNRQNSYPIIYATDGSSFLHNEVFQKTLDSLILSGIIKPLVFVESYSNTKIADSTSVTLANGNFAHLAFRNYEYIKYTPPSTDTSLAHRFSNHMRYFVDELIPQVELQLNQRINKSDRYFYGYSNGAGFGINLMSSHPDLIGSFLCFSMIGGSVERIEWGENVDYGSLYLKYGSKESAFLESHVVYLKEQFEQWRMVCDVEVYDGGHDIEIWNVKFIEMLILLFKLE